MVQKLIELFKYSSEHGLDLPAAYDNDKKGPSVSLLFAHISFYIAIVSNILVMVNNLIVGSMMAMTFSGLYFVFYMLRKLNKAKIDLDDKSFDLENTETKEEK